MLGGVAAGVLLLVLWRTLQSPSPPQINIRVDTDKLADAVKDNKPIVVVTSPSTTGSGGKNPENNGSGSKPILSLPSPQLSPPRRELPRDAVFLVQVEKAGRFWPFATCVAVDKQTLLTSAREAMQMAQWRQKEGFKLWAVSAALGLKKEIHEIHVHGIFAERADKPNDWIYFNLAVLNVEGALPKIATLASEEELGDLKEDAAVRFFGFTHQGEKTPVDRKFEPELVEGSIFTKSIAPAGLAYRPWLLHIKAKIPPNAYGSPIFNQQGNLVGIYGEPDASPAGAAVSDIHFAAVVVPAVIRRWTEGRDQTTWVSPLQSNAPGQTRSGGQ